MKSHYLDRGNMRQQSFTEYERQLKLILVDLGYPNMSDPNITSKDLEKATLDVLRNYLYLLEHSYI